MPLETMYRTRNHAHHRTKRTLSSLPIFPNPGASRGTVEGRGYGYGYFKVDMRRKLRTVTSSRREPTSLGS